MEKNRRFFMVEHRHGHNLYCGKCFDEMKAAGTPDVSIIIEVVAGEPFTIPGERAAIDEVPTCNRCNWNNVRKTESYLAY